MNNLNIRKILDIINYYREAKTVHKLHSPFVYSLAQNVLEHPKTHDAWKQIELHRQELKKKQFEFQKTDLGAGSTVHRTTDTSIVQILSSAVSPRWKCELLSNLCRQTLSTQVLELGTSLGISTAYLAAVAETVTTLEGDQTVWSFANEVFKDLQFDNIQSHHTPFDNWLSENSRPHFYDFIYIDGNHTYESTAHYANLLYPQLNEGGILVFDDIWWSERMMDAWEAIRNNETFRLTLTAFPFGLVVKNSNFRDKEHFSIIRRRWKPFQLGLF